MALSTAHSLSAASPAAAYHLANRLYRPSTSSGPAWVASCSAQSFRRHTGHRWQHGAAAGGRGRIICCSCSSIGMVGMRGLVECVVRGGPPLAPAAGLARGGLSAQEKNLAVGDTVVLLQPPLHLLGV